MLAAQHADEAPCHQPADNVNLCLTHCQEQTLDQHQIKVPDVSFQVVLSMTALPDVPQQALDRSSRPASPAAVPPPRILFCSFLL